MTPIVFLDTETDGVHPGRKAWEVAMIRRDDQGERTLSFFVDIDLDKADPFGLAVGRFYERHPRGRWFAGLDRHDPSCEFDVFDDLAHNGDLVSEQVAAILAARMTHGTHLVGAVPSFDAITLDGLLRENHLIPAWHYHLCDVEALAVGWLNGRADNAGTRDPRLPIRPPWKSDDLTLMLGIEPPTDEERHTALGDARWAQRIYDLIVPA